MTPFTSHGKLLLTGEYLVLHGAVALALPTKRGQSLTVETWEDHGTYIQWNAYQPLGSWFAATLDPATLDVISTDDQPKAQRLVQILRALRDLNPDPFHPGLQFINHMNFDPQWGLGSSSTLISNLAQWAKVDPYELLKRTFGGSGYDIACAQADAPIFYWLTGDQPNVQTADFNPPFADKLFFVYQGQKQSSAQEVKAFNQHWAETDRSSEIQTISQLSLALPTITYFEDFCALLQVHENILSQCLGRPPVQQQFPDFPGTLKSLGAWGGDFLLAATDLSRDEVWTYFRNKGFNPINPIFPYQDLIL